MSAQTLTRHGPPKCDVAIVCGAYRDFPALCDCLDAVCHIPLVPVCVAPSIRCQAQCRIPSSCCSFYGHCSWETVWYEWILNLRGLLYYSYDQKHTYTQGMYLIGA